MLQLQNPQTTGWPANERHAASRDIYPSLQVHRTIRCSVAVDMGAADDGAVRRERSVAIITG